MSRKKRHGRNRQKQSTINVLQSNDAVSRIRADQIVEGRRMVAAEISENKLLEKK
jgi:hypothetical protein